GRFLLQNTLYRRVCDEISPTQLLSRGSEPKKYPLFHAFPPKGVILNPSQNLSVRHTLPTLAVFCSRTLYIAGFVMKYRLTQLLSRGLEPKKYPLFHAFPPKGVILNRL